MFRRRGVRAQLVGAGLGVPSLRASHQWACALALDMRTGCCTVRGMDKLGQRREEMGASKRDWLKEHVVVISVVVPPKKVK